MDKIKAKGCKYQVFRNQTRMCIIDEMKTDLMKECRPFYLACDRADFKSGYKPVEMYKSERLA